MMYNAGKELRISIPIRYALPIAWYCLRSWIAGRDRINIYLPKSAGEEYCRRFGGYHIDDLSEQK
jgi:hypothetical protein